VLKRGLGEDQILRSQTVRQKLLNALLSPSSFSELFQKTGMSTATLSRYLKLMEEAGEIQRKIEGGSVVYMLTPLGLREAHTNLTPLENEIARKLYLFGATLDLRDKDSATKLTRAEPSSSNIFKQFAILEHYERRYLNFLAELYVHSVKKFLDKLEGELNFVEVRAAWQVVTRNAWDGAVQKEGLHFDYSSTWDNFYRKLDQELKDKLAIVSLNKEIIFRKLRAFSFPPKDRMKLIKDGII
jgi:predicted transcriptional regulator